MDINELRKENDLVDLFCNLAQVTSPSHHEEKVLDWICDYCKKTVCIVNRMILKIFI